MLYYANLSPRTTTGQTIAVQRRGLVEPADKHWPEKELTDLDLETGAHASPGYIKFLPFTSHPRSTLLDIRDIASISFVMSSIG